MKGAEPIPETSPEEMILKELLACLTREEQALMEAAEAEILGAAREKAEILARLAALQETGGHPAAETVVSPELRRRVAAQVRRNRAIIDAALETIRDFLHLLAPPEPGVYQHQGHLKPPGGGGLVQRRA